MATKKPMPKGKGKPNPFAKKAGEKDKGKTPPFKKKK